MIKLDDFIPIFPSPIELIQLHSTKDAIFYNVPTLVLGELVINKLAVNFEIAGGLEFVYNGQNQKPEFTVSTVSDYVISESEYDVIPKYYYTLSEGMTYELTHKTRIDAKFIIKSYQSMDKDQVEYYLQFKPSQKTHFDEDDELYYFETNYRNRYGNDNFCGLYVDIPDDEGIYHKWMILKKEIANQFVKYLILPVNHELMWIERNGQEKIKRRMWAILRNQNSYDIMRFILETICRKFSNAGTLLELVTTT